MECVLSYLCMVTVPHIMVGLERMSDYRGIGLARFHCIFLCVCVCVLAYKRIQVKFHYNLSRINEIDHY